VPSDARIAQFLRDGFVKIAGAFPRGAADEGRATLWRDTGCEPDDPTTWTKPVIRLGLYGQAPFAQAAITPILHHASDQPVGRGRWLPRLTPRDLSPPFPPPDDPGDAGWHIDVSFAPEAADPNDFLAWCANVTSKGRALLLLLFSDVGEDEAPTRIRAGSHLDMAGRLAPAGEGGLSLRELSANGCAETAGRPAVLATGEAGAVYLCRPFLVHAAQPHRGTRPRFMAQPPLPPADPLVLEREDGDYSPVKHAIRNALRDVPQRTNIRLCSHSISACLLPRPSRSSSGLLATERVLREKFKALLPAITNTCKAKQWW
jgi:Phytanoyl-CoA dioxygenase (PhyH)